MKSEKARNRQKRISFRPYHQRPAKIFHHCGLYRDRKINHRQNIKWTRDSTLWRAFLSSLQRHKQITLSRRKRQLRRGNKNQNQLPGQAPPRPKARGAPSKILLIQLELKHVVHKLGHKVASKNPQKKIKELTDIPTLHKNKSDP